MARHKKVMKWTNRQSYRVDVQFTKKEREYTNTQRKSQNLKK